MLFTNCQRVMKGSTFEVVAFLEVQGLRTNGDWPSAQPGSWASSNRMLFMTDGKFGYSDYQLSPDYTKATFLADLEATLRTTAQTDALLAAPHTDENLRGLLALALVHGEPMNGLVPWQSYYLEKIAAAFRDPQFLRPVALPEAEPPLVRAIAAATHPRDQEILLDLAQMVPLRDDAMPALAPFAGRDQFEGSSCGGDGRPQRDQYLSRFTMTLALISPSTIRAIDRRAG